MNNEINTTTNETKKFDTCFQAWTTLFKEPHTKIMEKRKALKAEFDKMMKEYKEKVEALKKVDDENYAKWLEAQKTLQGERKDAKEAKAKEAAEKKEAKAEAKKEVKVEAKTETKTETKTEAAPKKAAKKTEKKEVKKAA